MERLIKNLKFQSKQAINKLNLYTIFIYIFIYMFNCICNVCCLYHLHKKQSGEKLEI